MAARTATPKKPQGLARYWNTTSLRRAVQLYFVLFLAFVVIRATIVGENAATFVPGGEAYSPFGGLESLYRWISTGFAKFAPHTHWSNLVLFAGLAATTVAFKGAFCGWICPFGALQEWIGLAATKLGLKPRTVSPRYDGYLRWVKYAVMLWAVVGAAATGVLVFRDYDPFHALVAGAEVTLNFSLFMLAATFVGSVFINRPWCKYLCPLGAAVGLLGRLSIVKIKRDESACTSCGLCDRKCPMQVKVSTVDRVNALECNSCLTCVESCPVNALHTGPAPSAIMTRSKPVQGLFFAVAALVIFFVPYGVAKATDVWTTSGKFDGTGTAVVVTGKDPAEIKGWMTLADIATGYGVTVDEIVKQFKLDPAVATPTTAVNKLENESFSTDSLRTWLKEKQAAAVK